MMSTGARILLALLMLGSVAWVQPEPVFAYGGPGSVISGLGTLLAAIAAVLAALFGFIWFPLKRLYANLTEDSAEEEEVA